VELQLHAFLISALDRSEWLASCPGRFISREEAHSTHWTEVWVGSTAGLDAVAKKKIPSLPLPGVEPRL